jgi:hypothetical protein
MLTIVKRRIAGSGKSHDELSENPFKTSVSRRPDFKKIPCCYFPCSQGNPSLERVRERSNVHAGSINCISAAVPERSDLRDPPIPCSQPHGILTIVKRGIADVAKKP